MIAVFPGSFDPFTLGHQRIAERALLLCDKLVIAVGCNMYKKGMFAPEERKRRIDEVFAGENRIETAIYTGLTIDFCKHIGAKIIIRGIRNIADCHSEILIAQANRQIDNSIETIFLLAHPADSAISSSIIREVITNGGDAATLLPTLDSPKR
jgi:pantetheine-phosphate adenylyltransferase